MTRYAQANRLLAVSTHLGEDVLLLERFSGSEALSGLFSFRLDLLAQRPAAIPFSELLGQPVTVAVARPGGTRHFHGIVSRLTQGGVVRAAEEFVRFQAEVVPKLWLLTRTRHSRTFQHVNVPAILEQVLDGLDVSWQLQGSYGPRDYCVQYRESDFDFASRLMEDEGIYYYFKHADGAHTMVVADRPQSHADVPGPTSLVFEEVLGGTREEDRVLAWEKSQEVRAGRQVLRDHCFEMPGDNLEATRFASGFVAVGTVNHQLGAGRNDRLEVYDYPGGYAGRYDGLDPGGGVNVYGLSLVHSDGDRTVAIRAQQEAALGLVVRGESNCRHLSAGHRFSLTRHFNADDAYVLTQVEHEASIEGAYTHGADATLRYHNRFHCIPVAVPFRPARVTPKARVEGVQTAVVVGLPGEEIFTDKYGRVKVQFHWDREGRHDADSSCWVRVATSWAGQHWGAVRIPRVGQEVVVAFLEGDPDQPIIVGSVYNAARMPPYQLPEHRTQSGVKSRSSVQGGPDDFNELRFEDKKGEEQIFFHAQKDFVREVEHDDSLAVGRDQTITIERDRTVEISMGSDALTIKQGDQTTKLDCGKSTTEAMKSIELKVGQNSIKIDKNGVTVQGLAIKLQGQVQVQAQAPIVQVSGDGMLQLKGGIVTIN